MNTNNKTKRVIGVMSGTSLDAIDLVCVDFWQQKSQIQYAIIAAKAYPYLNEWKSALRKAHELSPAKLCALDAAYGNFLGQKINEFRKDFNLENIDLISSHGHTILHDPASGYTLQIGHGAHIQASTQLMVICDFRAQDVALGGQGAPLVPIGDQLLFAHYDACINLGGFANISFQEKNRRIAFDICPVNFVLNHLAQITGKEFDRNGEIAASAKVDNELIHQLNQLEFYDLLPPKSLGREWVDLHFFPLLNKSKINIEDKIATCTVHAAEQIAHCINKHQTATNYFTGGGAKNEFLMAEITKRTDKKIIIADDEILEFKEALIFALLGFLRLEKQINILKSVTGAQRNSSSGIIYK
ncbi:MAG: anhydro-N-acetylmuramic acid kinase [Flavobacteriaceae bacterium]|nr:anhydro-N-acetylmuramic acid kinase [Flavobacteriaceae bacterium]